MNVFKSTVLKDCGTKQSQKRKPMILFTIIFSLIFLFGSAIGFLKFKNHRSQIAFQKRQQLQLIEEQEADAMMQDAENGKPINLNKPKSIGISKTIGNAIKRASE